LGSNPSPVGDGAQSQQRSLANGNSRQWILTVFRLERGSHM